MLLFFKIKKNKISRGEFFCIEKSFKDYLLENFKNISLICKDIDPYNDMNIIYLGQYDNITDASKTIELIKSGIYLLKNEHES